MAMAGQHLRLPSSHPPHPPFPPPPPLFLRRPFLALLCPWYTRADPDPARGLSLTRSLLRPTERAASASLIFSWCLLQFPPCSPDPPPAPGPENPTATSGACSFLPLLPYYPLHLLPWCWRTLWVPRPGLPTVRVPDPSACSSWPPSAGFPTKGVCPCPGCGARLGELVTPAYRYRLSTGEEAS